MSCVCDNWMDGTERWCYYIWQGKAEVLGAKPSAPQIPHRLARAWTLASAVTGRQLTARAAIQLLVLFWTDVYIWDTCVIGAIKSILIAAANGSVIHQIAVIYLSSLSFHFFLQSCRRYQSTCARTGRRSIQNGSSMGRRYRCTYWTASISHFASISYSEWRAGKETTFKPLNARIKSHLLFAGIISSPFSPR